MLELLYFIFILFYFSFFILFIYFLNDKEICNYSYITYHITLYHKQYRRKTEKITSKCMFMVYLPYSIHMINS